MADDDIYILGDSTNAHQDPFSAKNVFSSEDSAAVLDILKNAVNRKASDVHFQVGNHPIFRADGILIPFMPAKPITNAFITNCVEMFLSKEQRKHLYENRQVDCSATLPNLTHRFRINFFYQQNRLSIAIRINPTTPPTIEKLGLPPFLEKLASLPHGLVLITGAPGSGKSTTLAAIVNHMNNHRNAHIITLSDPIEYVHKNKQSVLSQREIGIDATSFANALRVVLREDPDVVIVEEVRDLETIAMALTAAETGNLVFATLHTNDAVQAIDRIIDVFPPQQQNQIRVQLAMTLTAVTSQVLVQKKEGRERVAIFETMPVTTAIRHLIRCNQTMQIYNVIATSRDQGMISRSDALKESVRRGIITQETADGCFTDATLFEENE